MQLPLLIKTEFHCHTCYSKDSLVTLESLRSTCREKGIHRLVITDHNNIQGAVLAHRLDPELFIIGEEIMTQQGELLAIFLKDEIPGGLPASQAIELLRAQGSFIAVAHPFDTLRSGHWQLAELLAIKDSIDAIEIFNSRCLDPRSNRLARDFAQQNYLLGTVGSDSHSTSEVGAATLHLPDFQDAESLRAALPKAQLDLRLSPPWVHFYSRYAKWRKKLFR